MLLKENAFAHQSDDGRIYLFLCQMTDCHAVLRVRSSGFQKHSGFCGSCCKKKKPYWSVYNNFKSHVKRSNARRGKHTKVDLTYDDFVFLTQIRTCCYCGEANIHWLKYMGDGPFRYNLDRVDNSRGYSMDNVVVCCKECNQMKRDWYTGDEFRVMRLLLRCWRNASDYERRQAELHLVTWSDRQENL